MTPKNLQNQFEALNHIYVGICIIDKNYNTIFWNDSIAEWTGISSNQIAGKDLRTIVPKLCEPQYKLRIQNVIEGGPPAIFSSQLHMEMFPFKLPNGKLRKHQTTVSSFQLDGDETLVLFSCQDVTELTGKIDEIKNARKELVAAKNEVIEANQAKDRFFSIIAHDLRSPFSSLVSYMRLITESLNKLSEEELQEITEELYEKMDSTQKLLENLLLWSQMQKGQIKFEPKRFFIDMLIKEIKILSAHRAAEKNISIEFLTQNDLQIFADKEMTSTVLRNLVSNSIKFCRSGDSINVTVSQNTSETTFTVQDTGIGMSEFQISNLFEIDKKRKSYGTAGEQGSGLGLILCKEFIERHGGSLHVESQEGQGSTFTVNFPN